ncbi:hypothetical protein [Saccharothrix syringae]|uniref:Uncharacterized protein n=1 Tax=Saccharothrix syringae TaxID=103733 RepID=A0A5Q0GWE7_SACSY|nr:hypothetical protein [Saccharothrix syringae]QFZ18387.1 hypothetical protein EKG83_13630 [Saccharothrix syringae]
MSPLASRNDEHAELVRFLLPLIPVLAVFGMNALDEVEKLNIRYEVYEQQRQRAESAFKAVREGAQIMADVRDEVGAGWKGEAAELFDRYAGKAVTAADAETSLVDLEDQAIGNVFAEVKKIVETAANALMSLLQSLAAVVSPAAGAAVALDRLVSGGEGADVSFAVDVTAALEIVLNAMKEISGLSKVFEEAGEGRQAVQRFRDADGRSLGSLLLLEAKDFRIDPNYSTGAIPTGLEERDRADEDAWAPR